MLLSVLSFIFAKMIIGINSCGAFKNQEKWHDNFIIDCFNEIADRYPEHSFVFFTDEERKKEITSKNNIAILISPRPQNTLLWQFWYNYKLGSIVKKQKIDVMIHLDGICSLRSKIAQLLFLSDLPALHSIQTIEKSHFRFYKKHAAQFLQKAKRIVTVSPFLTKEIIDTYTIDRNKIDVVYAAANTIFVPLPWEEKEQVKEKYTAGREYFLYSGDINQEKNLITLLKAFSFFKKRQKSNMQLVIVSNDIAIDFEDSLQTYKYREDVKLLSDLSLSEQAKITGAAYVFMYPSLYEVFSIQILEAMQCAVPVIASNIAGIATAFENAILYINPDSFEDIADKMMLVFKDENKRNELILKSTQQVMQYDLDKTINLLWQSIVKTTPA